METRVEQTGRLGSVRARIGRAGGRWRRVARWTARVAVAAGLAYAVLLGVQEAYEYATSSPRFEVRGLRYQPTAHVDDLRLRELMALPPGTNILSLDLREIAERITADPWVARASVVRELPDTLVVEVTEHQPTAVLAAGEFHLLDTDGTPFKVLERGDRGDLPIITGITRARLLQNPAAAKADIARALEVLEAYRAKRRPRLSEINVDETGNVTLYTAELGTQLRLGRIDPVAALARFDALRAALGEETEKLAVAHLDASFGPERRDRVVASFFPGKEPPSVLEEAERRRAEKSAAAAARDENHDETSKRRARKRSRLPRYE